MGDQGGKGKIQVALLLCNRLALLRKRIAIISVGSETAAVLFMFQSCKSRGKVAACKSQHCVCEVFCCACFLWYPSKGVRAHMNCH